MTKSHVNIARHGIEVIIIMLQLELIKYGNIEHKHSKIRKISEVTMLKLKMINMTLFY